MIWGWSNLVVDERTDLHTVGNDNVIATEDSRRGEIIIRLVRVNR